MSNDKSRIFDALHQYFKFESFKSKLQQDAIEAICKSNFTAVSVYASYTPGIRLLYVSYIRLIRVYKKKIPWNR